MASKTSDLSPPRSDALAKTRLQSLLDSPSRVTRSQARRQSNVPKEAPMSPRVTVRRKRTGGAADETCEGSGKNENNKSPQGRNAAVAAGNSSSPSRTSQTTRSRKSSFSVKEEAPKELPAPGRRVSLRLQNVEGTGHVTRRTRGSLKVQEHAEVQQSPVRRTRRSSVTSSVTSPSRNNRNRRKLSPVPSLDSSAISGSSSDAKSQPRTSSKSSPLSKKVSPQNDGSPGARRTSQTFHSTSRLSSGKIIGVVSPSKGTPLKSPCHSRMKSPELFSGTSPSARLHADDQGQSNVSGDVQSQNLHKRISLSEKSLCLSAPSLLTSTSQNMTVKEFSSVKKKGRLSLQRRSSSPMRNLFVVIPRNLNADYQAASGGQSGSNSSLKSPQVEAQGKNSFKEVKPAVEENLNSTELLEKHSSCDSSKSSLATEAESSFEDKAQSKSKNSLPDSDLEAEENSNNALKKSDKKTPLQKRLRTSSCEGDVQMLSRTEPNKNSPANESPNASQNLKGRTSLVNVSTGKLTSNSNQDGKANLSSRISVMSTESDTEPEVELKTQNKSPGKRTSLHKLPQTSSSDDNDNDYEPPRKTASKENSPATKSANVSLNLKGKIAQSKVSPRKLALLDVESSSDEEHNSSGKVSTSPESPISLQIPDSSSDDETEFVNKNFPEKTSSDKNTSLKTKQNEELSSTSDSEEDETQFRKVTVQKMTPSSAAKSYLTMQLDSSDRLYEVNHVSKALIDKATPAKLAFDRTPLRSSTPGNASQVKSSQGSFHEGKDSPDVIYQSKQTHGATPNSAKRSEGGSFVGKASPYGASEVKDTPGTSSEGDTAHAKSTPGSSSRSKAPDSATSTPRNDPQVMLHSRNLLKGKMTPDSGSQTKGTPGSASQSRATPGTASQAKSTPASSSKGKASDIAHSTPSSAFQSKGTQNSSFEREATSGSSSEGETPDGAMPTPTHSIASPDSKTTSDSPLQVKLTPSQRRTTPGVASQPEFRLSAGKTPGSIRPTPDRASQAKYTTDSSSEGKATPDSSFKAKDTSNKSTEGKCTPVVGATFIQSSFGQGEGTSNAFQGGASLQDNPFPQRASLSMNSPSRHGSNFKIVTSASSNVEPDTESENDQLSTSDDNEMQGNSVSGSNVLDLDTNMQESTGARLLESSDSDNEEEISETCLIKTMKPIPNKYSPMKTSPSKLFKGAHEELIDQSSSESNDESFGLSTILKWNNSNSDNYHEKSDESDDLNGSLSSKTKYLKRVEHERKAANESSFPDFDSDEEFSQAADVVISDTDEDIAKVANVYENLLAELNIEHSDKKPKMSKAEKKASKKAKKAADGTISDTDEDIANLTNVNESSLAEPNVEHTDKEPKMSKAEKKALKKAKKAAKLSANSDIHNLSTEKSPCLPRSGKEKETSVKRINLSVEPAQGLDEDGVSPTKKMNLLKESIEYNSNEIHLYGDAQGKNRRKLKKKQKVLGELHPVSIPGAVSAELEDDPVNKKSKKRKLQQSQLEEGLHKSQKQTELLTEEHEAFTFMNNTEETKRKRKKKASNLTESEEVISENSQQLGLKQIEGIPLSVTQKTVKFSSEISRPKAKTKKELQIAVHEGSRTDDLSHMAVSSGKKKKSMKMHGLVDEETEEFEVGAETDKKKKKKKKKTKEMQNVAERETEETEACSKPEKKRNKRKAKEMQDLDDEEPKKAEISADLHKKKKKKIKETHDLTSVEGEETALSTELKKKKKKMKEKGGFVVKEVGVAKIYSSESVGSSKERKIKVSEMKEKHFKRPIGTEHGDSDSDDAPVSVSFGAARQEALAESRAASESIKAQKERKKEKSRKLLELRKQQLLAKVERQKRKRETNVGDFDDSAPGTSGLHDKFTRKGILYNKQPSASSKRLPPEVLESLSEQPPSKAMRKQDDGKSTQISEDERKNLEKKRKKLALKMAKHKVHQQDYIPLESESGATRFGVVPLRNIMASRNKLANEATSFRKEMLFGQRVKRTPISTYLAYEEKLKASSKDKF